MEKIIQVQKVAVSCCHAKEAMQKVVEYMQNEPIKVAEMVTLQTLMKIMEQEVELQQLQEFDFTFAGNKEVLASAGVTDARLLKEADEMLFLKMFLCYLHKNHQKIFLLTMDSEDADRLKVYFQENYSGITIAGMATLEEQGISDDHIVNLINGTEAECILTFWESPIQEQFITRNRQALHARLWIGLGLEAKDKIFGGRLRNQLRNLIASLFIRNKIKQVKKNPTK